MNLTPKLDPIQQEVKMGLKKDLGSLIGFFIRLAAASAWIALTMIAVVAVYAIVPESTMEGNGWIAVSAWAVVAYVGAHYGVWRR